jgi:hypothetical protein
MAAKSIVVTVGGGAKGFVSYVNDDDSNGGHDEDC